MNEQKTSGSTALCECVCVCGGDNKLQVQIKFTPHSSTADNITHDASKAEQRPNSNAESLHFTIAEYVQCTCTWICRQHHRRQCVCVCVNDFSSYYYIYLLMAWANTLHSIESYKLKKNLSTLSIESMLGQFDSDDINLLASRTRAHISFFFYYFFLYPLGRVEWKGRAKVGFEVSIGWWLIWIYVVIFFSPWLCLTRSFDKLFLGHTSMASNRNRIIILANICSLFRVFFFFILFLSLDPISRLGPKPRKHN